MLYDNRGNHHDDAEHTVKLNRLLVLLGGMVLLGLLIWAGIDWS